MNPRYAHAPKQRTLTEIRNEMLMLLVSCTDDAWTRLSVDSLHQRYSRLRRDVIAADYAAESARRQKRAGGL